VQLSTAWRRSRESSDEATRVVRNPTVRASGLANALALKSSEACSKAQSKACQDTQPAKQEVEHAQVSRQGPDASQKEPNTTTFSRLVWPPWFLCWAEVSPSHPRALLHQSTGPLVRRHVGAPFRGGDSVTKQSEAIGSTKQTVSVLGPVVL
jgi:hypothetical protein